MADIAKLHYFKGRGRAETTRWMLAVNEIKFENVSLSNPADFENLKSAQKLPFNQLPLLEIDGLNLSQSTAMIGYLARRGGLYGDGPIEAVCGGAKVVHGSGGIFPSAGGVKLCHL